MPRQWHPHPLTPSPPTPLPHCGEQRAALNHASAAAAASQAPPISTPHLEPREGMKYVCCGRCRTWLMAPSPAQYVRCPQVRRWPAWTGCIAHVQAHQPLFAPCSCPLSVPSREQLRQGGGGGAWRVIDRYEPGRGRQRRQSDLPVAAVVPSMLCVHGSEVTCKAMKGDTHACISTHITQATIDIGDGVGLKDRWLDSISG